MSRVKMRFLPGFGHWAIRNDPANEKIVNNSPGNAQIGAVSRQFIGQGGV